MSRWQSIYGRARQFDPRTIGEVAVWMDAADASTVTLNGSNISEWRSKVGSLAAAQATASLQPAYTTSGQNGRNCVTFDGTGRRMTYNGGSANSFWSFLHDGTTPYAVYWVGSATSPNTHTYLSDTRGAGGLNDGAGLAVNHDFGQVYGNPTIRVLIRGTGGIVAQVDATLSSATVGAMELLGDLSNATVGNRMRLRVNNGSQSSSSAGAGTLSTAAPQGPMSLGSNGVGTLFALNGRICEVLVYKGQITTAQASAVRRYLIRKWGL